jgi:outer membrane protein insertion porin family
MSVRSIIILSLILFTGCNVTKYLKPGEQLYTGANVQVKAPVKKHAKMVRKEMKKLLRPEPNATLLGWRYRLWFYYKAGENPQSRLKKFMKNKIGEPPVIFDLNMADNLSTVMNGRLLDIGFFNANVRSQLKEKKRKVFVTYHITVRKPYTVKSVEFPAEKNLITEVMGSHTAETLIKPGEIYSLDKLRDERVRIDAALKNEGFYFFNPDYLLFRADSTAGEQTVKLKLTVKPAIPQKALLRYYINNITLVPEFSRHDSGLKITDTLRINGYTYLRSGDDLNPEAVLRHVFLKPGDRYSRKAYSLTLSRLMSMGIFRYVNIRFRDTIIENNGRLDVLIQLTPMYKRSLQVSLEAITKSNNYTGPSVTGTYKNRNLFKGAELLNVNVNGSFETQFTGPQKGFNSYELGLNSQLYLPRFLTPFRLTNVSTMYVPRTKIDLGLRYLNRVLYFSMNAVNFTFGYTWKESARKEHVLNPVAISFARLLNTTEIFRQLLNDNLFLRKSFEQQFTVGGNYNFIYNSLSDNNNPHQFYFNGFLDLSGNSIGGLQSLVRGAASTEDSPHLLFRYRYAQFVKPTIDFRYYSILDKDNRIVTRFIAGVGFAYGNSQSLPYFKQFFSGGAGSIRAFLPRTVGPGSYRLPDSLYTRVFTDKAGDIKLEGNIEYRFTIAGVFKGAVFADAGNIWLLHPNDQFPGGEFRQELFLTQLAVGTGFGLRIDIKYFVIRADIGIPLRKPYLPLGERWVIDQIDLLDGRWRAQNLVLNLAIGYPF